MKKIHVQTKIYRLNEKAMLRGAIFLAAGFWLVMIALVHYVLSKGYIDTIRHYIMSAKEETALYDYDVCELPSVSPGIPSENDTYCLETVNEELWLYVDYNGRLNFFQAVVNSEEEYLGLPETLTVAWGDMPLNRYAEYNDETKEIRINRWDWEMMGLKDGLIDVCEATFHAYQIELVKTYETLDEKNQNLLIFRDVRSYQYEFENPVSESDDFNAFYHQKNQENARSYAKERVLVYLQNGGE